MLVFVEELGHLFIKKVLLIKVATDQAEKNFLTFLNQTFNSKLF